jgi:hypothetical protein
VLVSGLIAVDRFRSKSREINIKIHVVSEPPILKYTTTDQATHSVVMIAKVVLWHQRGIIWANHHHGTS